MPTPTPLITAGTPIFGVFEQPVTPLNLMQFNYTSPMGKPLGKVRKLKALKHFNFISIIDRNFIIALSYLKTWQGCNWFIYHYDVATKQLTQHQVEDFFGLASTITPEYGTVQHYKRFGVSYVFDYSQPTVRISITTPKLSCNFSFNLQPTGNTPLVLNCPVGVNGMSYTHKAISLPVEGSFTVNNHTQSFTSHSLLNLDWTAGFLRPSTFWHWASISGYINNPTSNKQVTFGLNLAAGVNETGMSENAYWIDGKRFLLPFSRFSHGGYDALDALKPWTVSAGVTVQLQFTPLDGLFKKKQLGIIDVDFKQIFGYFSGTLEHEGQTFIIDNQLGFVEYQYINW